MSIPCVWPPGELLEIAVSGRSNVGKSSLINSLLNRRALAKVSGTPGKTRLLQYFLINDAFNLVDLPGDLAGVLPDGVGAMPPERFQAAAPDWLTPLLFGRAEPERLRSDGVPGPPPEWPEPIDLSR